MMEPSPSPQQPRKWLWQGRLQPAFWTVGSSLSLLLNVILLIVIAVLLQQLFTIKKLVNDQLIDGLYTNFVRMDQAVIQTTVQVDDTIPVQFTLPLNQQTDVVLTEDTFVQDVTVNLNTGGLYIQDAQADITLPKGTVLKVALNMDVPVDTTIPVRLTVPVNIPLQETQLHDPFVGLQQVVAPYRQLLQTLPDSWNEALKAAP
ncbi:MAG: hypothetical protein D6755_12025 [Anaerolineae bacterium]|nr:MAG: hypothetical protein D6755_12025 [Anaerolineae bacterium]